MVSFDALTRMFPDAMPVLVHRDPGRVLVSAARLTELLRAPFTTSRGPRTAATAPTAPSPKNSGSIRSASASVLRPMSSALALRASWLRCQCCVRNTGFPPVVAEVVGQRGVLEREQWSSASLGTHGELGNAEFVVALTGTNGGHPEFGLHAHRSAARTTNPRSEA